MSTIDHATLKILINLARESVAAREAAARTERHDELATCREALANAEAALRRFDGPAREEQLEAALADCYTIVHELRHGYRETELSKNASAIEREARELLGIGERRVQPID
jgi:hypothetical protein